MKREKLNKLSNQIIRSSIEVHKYFGPGMYESVYEHCLIDELKKMGVSVETQVRLPLNYKGRELNKYFVMDIVVENEIILELKCVETILPVHEVQLVTYLKLADKRLGFILNFYVDLMKNGIRRKVNNF